MPPASSPPQSQNPLWTPVLVAFSFCFARFFVISPTLFLSFRYLCFHFISLAVRFILLALCLFHFTHSLFVSFCLLYFHFILHTFLFSFACLLLISFWALFISLPLHISIGIVRSLCSFCLAQCLHFVSLDFISLDLFISFRLLSFHSFLLTSFLLRFPGSFSFHFTLRFICSLFI